MPSTRAVVVSALGAFLFGGTAHAQRSLYAIEAELDPASHEVQGSMAIEFVNTSRATLRTLEFHLYLNAFEGENTVFMTESGGQLRGDVYDGAGGIDLHSLEVARPNAEADDRLPSADGELVEGDRTQLRVPLRDPIHAGDTRRITISFTSRLPPVFARSGYHGDFHMVAQWFPKLAKLEADGSWANFPYHGHGEFYADFADYEVSIRTPQRWEVGATGSCRRVAPDGDLVEHTFTARNVHDFAFATAPWFHERRHVVPGGPRVRILFPPGYASAAERHLEVTLAGLARYGENLGEYPYSTLTVIVPPRGAGGAAGMEYPTLFVTAGPWWRFGGMPMALHDEVTAHELGHQWFQGMVATNEVAWPMLDEGLTEWITSDLLQTLHGGGGAMTWPLPRLSNFEAHRFVSMRGRITPPPGRPAHAFGRNEYGRSVYSRSTSIFESVARTWGRGRFLRAIGRYARAGRFQHPGPAELFSAFDAEYGPWMSQRILRPALLDGAVAVRRVRLDRGRAIGERFGGLPLPTRVRLSHRSGRVDVVPWPGGTVRFESEATDIVAAEADFDRHGLLDPDRRDDRAVAAVAEGDASGALFAFQVLLGWFGA